VVGCWHGYLSGAWCRLAYDPADATATLVSCFSKIQIGFTFLVPAHLGSPGPRAAKRVCVCVATVFACIFTHCSLSPVQQMKRVQSHQRRKSRRCSTFLFIHREMRRILCRREQFRAILRGKLTNFMLFWPLCSISVCNSFVPVISVKSEHVCQLALVHIFIFSGCLMHFVFCTFFIF